MKIKKMFYTALCFMFLAYAAAARDAEYNGKNYSIALTYNDTACPGDAVFVRMKLFAPRGYKKSKTAATLELKSKKKKIDGTDFFSIKNGINGIELLAGIPLSSYLEPDEYQLVITYSFSGSEPMDFSLPLVLTHKDFASETVSLSESDTSIKTDSSPSHLNQVKKLNTILRNIAPGDVYQFSRFIQPVSTTQRSAQFADRRIYQYAGGKSSKEFHYGIDFSVPAGTAVCACADGKVMFAENCISSGLSVVIEHLPGLYSMYYHLKSLNVKEGQMVKQGDKIGFSGTTGLSASPHLHWEIRLNTCAVNPDFFTGDFAFDDRKK